MLPRGIFQNPWLQSHVAPKPSDPYKYPHRSLACTWFSLQSRSIYSHLHFPSRQSSSPSRSGMERLAISRNLRWASVHHPPSTVQQKQVFIRLKYPKSQLQWRKLPSWAGVVSAASLKAEISSGELSEGRDETTDKPDSRMLSAEELNALTVDAERTRLIGKLSEANQYNRILRRQLRSMDDDVINLKSDLADLELELQALVGLAEEVSNLEIPPGTRKINGEYIQCHLLSRLQAVNDKLRKQIEGVDLIKSQEITLHWVGVAESVQVMGSFDGWSQGEEMSPEYDGGYNKFAATLKLRPGRYELKFLVDGQWQLSPELPTIGEGVAQNNLLIV